MASPKIAINNETLKDTLKAMMSQQGALGSTLIKVATMDKFMPGGALGAVTKATLGKIGITWDDYVRFPDDGSRSPLDFGEA